MTNIIQILLGIVILTTGRKLYWLFVGVVGFVVGIALAGMFFPSETEIARLAIALVAGVICALLALFLQRLAVGLVGFLAGGYVALALLDALQIQLGVAAWIIFVVGGIISAALVAALFDWALILLSSLTGASMVIQAFDLGELLNFFVFVFLIVMGIGIQASVKRNEAPKPKS
jgi:hypothetical protein